MNNLEKRIGLADVRTLRADAKPQSTGIIDQEAIEMKRAGFTEMQAAVAKRVDTVLALGKEQDIQPCNGCPLKDTVKLCKNELTLTPSGTLDCPGGKGIVRIYSLGK